MLLENKTKEKFGYDVSSLTSKSTLLVCWKCDRCGFENNFFYYYYLMKKEKAKTRNGEELCQTCSHSHRKGQVTKKKQEGQTWLPLPPEVSVEMTISRFGYNPHDLSPWSRKRVVVKCQRTGTVTTVPRANINNLKSVRETGHYISTGGITAEQRYGKKASEETKQLMKQAQSLRRKLEKQKKS